MKITLITVNFLLLRSPDTIILESSLLLVNSYINAKLFSVFILKPLGYFAGGELFTSCMATYQPPPKVREGTGEFAYINAHPHTKLNRCNYPRFTDEDSAAQEVKSLTRDPTAAKGRARLQDQVCLT